MLVLDSLEFLDLKSKGEKWNPLRRRCRKQHFSSQGRKNFSTRLIKDKIPALEAVDNIKFYEIY